MSRAIDTSLRENRVAVMMSSQELEAVDNWRFANRIGSRGEAMRQLIGFALDKLQAREATP